MLIFLSDLPTVDGAFGIGEALCVPDDCAVILLWAMCPG